MPKMLINVFEVSLGKTTEEGKTAVSISHRTMHGAQDVECNKFSSVI
jgi:hypothetical protein